MGATSSGRRTYDRRSTTRPRASGQAPAARHGRQATAAIGRGSAPYPSRCSPSPTGRRSETTTTPPSARPTNPRRSPGGGDPELEGGRRRRLRRRTRESSAFYGWLFRGDQQLSSSAAAAAAWTRERDLGRGRRRREARPAHGSDRGRGTCCRPSSPGGRGRRLIRRPLAAFKFMASISRQVRTLYFRFTQSQWTPAFAPRTPHIM